MFAYHCVSVYVWSLNITAFLPLHKSMLLMVSLFIVFPFCFRELSAGQKKKKTLCMASCFFLHVLICLSLLHSKEFSLTGLISIYLLVVFSMG